MKKLQLRGEGAIIPYPPNYIAMQSDWLHPSTPKTWEQFKIYANNVASAKVGFSQDMDFGQLRHELECMHAIWMHLTKDLIEADFK